MTTPDKHDVLAARRRAKASEVLARTGVRLVDLEPGFAIGVWSDLDGEELRRALAVFSENAPVLYLDGPDVPMRYKVRDVPGEPVPLDVLHAMRAAEAAGAKPWEVRNRLLKGKTWKKMQRVVLPGAIKNPT